MGAWIKGALLALVAFGLCWGGAIGYWRSANHMPTTSDLVVWMLAVPLALLALVLLGRKWMSMRAAAAAAPAAPAAGAAASPAATAPAGPGPALAVLAAAVRTPHGQSPAELAAAIDEGKARAELDSELTDDEGYPIMSARVADADDSAAREEIQAWLANRGIDDPHLSDEQWRALAMAGSVAAELAGAATAHPHAATQPDPYAPAATPPAPMLRLALLPAAGWNEAQHSAGAEWLRHVVTEAGWPAARIAVSGARPGSAAKLGDGAPALSTLLTLLTGEAAARKEEALLAMLLAFDSQIGSASVERLAADRRLFGSNRPQGCIPGEGAAGLLLSDAATARLIDPEAPLVHALSAQRDGSADEARRPDAATLRSLLAHAAAEGAVTPAKVALVVSDTDHRTSRVMELMALVTEGLPHLDAGTDVKASGTACGSCGAVPSLSALALACHHARELGAPVLSISNDDPHHRGAALVRPAALQS